MRISNNRFQTLNEEVCQYSLLVLLRELMTLYADHFLKKNILILKKISYIYHKKHHTKIGSQHPSLVS